MGRAIFVRTVLAVTLCLGSIAPSRATAASEPLVGAVTQDFWEEFESWMNELCSFVYCEADRQTLTGDDIAVSFVLHYEAFGAQQDLTVEQRNDGQAVSLKLLRMLADAPELFEPEIQEALEQSLTSLHEELSMR